MPIRGKPLHPGNVFPMQGNVWAWVFCRTCSVCAAKLLALKQNVEPPQQGGTRSRPSAGFLLRRVARDDKRRMHHFPASVKRRNPGRCIRRVAFVRYARTSSWQEDRNAGSPILSIHAATNASRVIWRDFATASIFSTSCVGRHGKTSTEHDVGRAISVNLQVPSPSSVHDACNAAMSVVGDGMRRAHEPQCQPANTRARGEA